MLKNQLEQCIKTANVWIALITHQLPFESLHAGLKVMKEKEVYRNKVMICQDRGESLD